MKKLIIPTLLGLFGLVSFLLQWEYLLAICELLCLAGFAWLIISKRIPIRTLPLLTATLVIGAIFFSQATIGWWADSIWPPSHAWLPNVQPQEEHPAIARYLLYRPHTWFYRMADALTGLCLAAILLPWFKHLAEKYTTATSVVIAGLLLLWLAVSSVILKISEGFIIGSPFAVYCITLMAIDLLSVKKGKAFYTVFISVLVLSLLVTLIVATIYHQHYYYGDIYVVIEWLVAYTAPLCSSLFYVVWPLCKKKLHD